MKKPPRVVRVDGEATRSRILEAAGELCASAGFGQTTSKAIAAQAEVDLASINYHFGSRDGLYQAVLKEAHRRLVDFADLQLLTQGNASASEKFRLLLDHLVHRATDDAEGWHLAVLAAEMMAPSSNVAVLFESEIPMKMALVVPVLAEIADLPIDHPALLPCLVSIGAPCLVLLIGRRGLPGPIQKVRQLPRDALVAHLHRFAVAGLKAIGEAQRQMT